MNILKETLENISLTKKEEKEIERKSKDFVKYLSKFVKRKIIIGGSLAKKTIIKKEKQDIDIFVIFDNEEETKELENILKKASLKYEVFHGSRDYFQIKKDDLLFEVVPLVKIRKKEDVKNVSDFSPLHVFYVRKKLKEDPSLIKEIKLAKAFCQSNEIYGAESYIKGFSGYAIEVLIIFYKSFFNFLKKIKKERFIDVERHFKNEKEARREINEQKILSPLILIDPVYKYRNLCAGLSEENFFKLKERAEKFLKKPSIEFFQKKIFDEKEFIKKSKEKNLYLLILSLTSSKKKEDVAATKMKKFFDFLKKEFNKKKQEVVDSKFIFLGKNRAKAFFSLCLNDKIKIYGPKKEISWAVKNFKKFHKKIFFEGGKAYSFEKFNLKDFLEKQKEVAESMSVFFSEERPEEDSNL